MIATNVLTDPCPKLQALGAGNPHVVTERELQLARPVAGRLKARCRYCSRSIDLGSAVVAVEDERRARAVALIATSGRCPDCLALYGNRHLVRCPVAGDRIVGTELELAA